VCDLENLMNEEALAQWGWVLSHQKQTNIWKKEWERVWSELLWIICGLFWVLRCLQCLNISWLPEEVLFYNRLSGSTELRMYLMNQYNNNWILSYRPLHVSKDKESNSVSVVERRMKQTWIEKKSGFNVVRKMHKIIYPHVT